MNVFKGLLLFFALIIGKCNLSLAIHSDKIASFPSGTLGVTEEVFNSKMNCLEFEVPMVYNQQVGKYIDFFAITWQKKLKEVLQLSEYYFPIYDRIFDRYDIPYEIKYLSIIESALNPNAVSKSGAVGLWQFMPATGKLYGLKNTNSIDERKSIEKATEAAAKYLRSSFERFGDWHLALASYNAGPGGISRAIKKSGGTNFWEIQPFLYKETQEYIPKYIAMTFVMNTYKDYGITPNIGKRDFKNINTIVCSEAYFLEDLALILQVDIATLKFWNPELKNGQLPSQKYELRLPEDYSYKFLENIEKLNRMHRTSQKIKAPQYTIHFVKRGESIPVIARHYQVSVGEIKSWNDLKSNLIFPNQKLKIYKSSENRR